GVRIAAACGDGNIKVWDLEKKRVTKILQNAHEGFASSVAFHPNGQHLASVGKDQLVKVWNWMSGKTLFKDRCDAVHGNGTAYAVAFGPDGRMLAAGNQGVVTIWDWKSGQIVHRLPGRSQQQTSVAFSRDGRHFASGDWAGSIKLWDAETGRESPGAFPDTHYPVTALAFNDDGMRLATASFNRSVDLWNTETCGRVDSLRHTDGIVLGIAFSPDGRRLASTGEDKTVRIWDPASGREILSLRGHDGICGCLAFSPDGQRLASASEDKTIRVWDATPILDDRVEGVLTWPDSNEIWTLAVSPDGQEIISAGWSIPIRIRNARTGRPGSDLPGFRTIVFCVAWQGQRIAAAGGDGAQFTVKVWNARNKRAVLCSLPEVRGGTEYTAIALSRDERYLVTGSKDGKVQVWDAENGQLVGTLGVHVRQVLGLVFSPDGSRLASASGDGKIKVWAWDPTRLPQSPPPEYEHEARVPGVYVNMAFSPDNRRLAHGGEGHMIKIRDAKSGQEQNTLRGHAGGICAVAFSPDGRRLATAGEDTTIRIWDTATWKLRHTLRGHTGVVSSLAFLPQLKRLVSGSRDHTIRVWDATQWDEAPEC
ncbi:MAG: WD40 repeat domain-containing protein, partial [Deltaproteobacteria bacterium]